MVTIRVFSKSTGKPVRGVRVTAFFEGALRGHAGPAYTDSEGDVHFDVDPGSGTVYVDGSEKYKGRLQGRVVVYT